MYIELIGANCQVQEANRVWRIRKEQCDDVILLSPDAVIYDSSDPDTLLFTRADNPEVFDFIESGTVEINPADHAVFFAAAFSLVAVSFLIGISLNTILSLLKR